MVQIIKKKNIFRKIQYSFVIGKACVISDWQGSGDAMVMVMLRLARICVYLANSIGNEAIRKQAGRQFEQISISI